MEAPKRDTPSETKQSNENIIESKESKGVGKESTTDNTSNPPMKTTEKDDYENEGISILNFNEES